MPLQEELLDHMVTLFQLRATPWQHMRGTISLQHLSLPICDCNQLSQSDMQGPRHTCSPQAGHCESRWRTISCGVALGTGP